jgi:hypothetical protein
VQGMVDQAVKKYLPSNSDLMFDFYKRMDMQPLAELVATNDDLTRAVVEKLGDDIDTDEIARKVGESVRAVDVALHMDAEDVANYVDVDSDYIAEKVAEDIDVSSCIDYDKLAEALVDKLKEAWA